MSFKKAMPCLCCWSRKAVDSIILFLTVAEDRNLVQVSVWYDKWSLMHGTTRASHAETVDSPNDAILAG